MMEPSSLEVPHMRLSFIALVLAVVNRRSLVRIVLGLVLVVEAFGYFEVPILAWPRAASVDTAPITYLRDHLGVQRYFSTGPAAPNYAAYYGVPSLGASEKSTPAKVTRTPLLAGTRRHAFQVYLPFAARSRKKAWSYFSSAIRFPENRFA